MKNIEITKDNIDEYRNFAYIFDQLITSDEISVFESVNVEKAREEIDALNDLIERYENEPKISDRIKEGAIFKRSNYYESNYIRINKICGNNSDIFLMMSTICIGPKIYSLRTDNRPLNNNFNNELEEYEDATEEEWSEVLHLSEVINGVYNKKKEVRL